MIDPLLVITQTREYLARNPREAERLEPFRIFLETNAPKQVISRKHLAGHVTTSGFLVNDNGESLLLIHHRKLDRFLQPGGHLEDDPTLLASALREIREEVGLQEEALTLCQPDHLPCDIDPHRIPARGEQPEHWHFDFRYLFRVRPGAEIACQADEVAGADWFGWESEEVRQILPEHVIRRLRTTICAQTPGV